MDRSISKQLEMLTVMVDRSNTLNDCIFKQLKIMEIEIQKTNVYLNAISDKLTLMIDPSDVRLRTKYTQGEN